MKKRKNNRVFAKKKQQKSQKGKGKEVEQKGKLSLFHVFFLIWLFDF
jgi:hypothetical protein